MEKKQNIFNILFETIIEHPFIFTALLCFGCITVTTGTSPSYWNLLIPTAIIFFLGVCASIYIGKHNIKQKQNQKIVSVALTALSATVSVVIFLCMSQAQSLAGAVFNIGIFIVLGVLIYLSVNDKLTSDKIIILIFAIGFIARLAYILCTPITSRQHDVSLFGKGHGHAGYIEYIYNNLKLPEGDVRETYQFYHPPLHHIISAIWLKIQTFFGIKFEYACENIQLLTLFYSSISMILSYKIFRQLNLKNNGLVCACAIVAFCPTFFIMAGSINNDMLSIVFILGATLNTIYWYKNQKFRYIIAVAFCIGLGMMTKLSVWMITPAIAFVFIYVFFKNLKNVKTNLLQFLTFGIICVPLGLWWSIRNLVSHGVPITYVPMLSEKSSQYIGDIPILQRLFDFRLYQFFDVGDQFTMYGGLYNEYNPTIALFKTSAFDELITVSNYFGIAGFNHILFWSSLVIGVIGFISMIYYIFFKKNDIISVPTRIFIFLLYAVTFVSYYIFCIKFQHVCTQNIRYAVLLIVLGAYFAGRLIQDLSKDKNKLKKHKKIFKNSVYVVIALFCVSSVLVYDIVATVSII